MKIIIPTENQNVSSNICVSFGRTPYFAIYNTETKETEFLINAAANAAGGAGIKAAQTIVEQKANFVISAHLGQNAADVLLGSGIKLLKAIAGTVEANIKAFENDELKPLNDVHPGHHKSDSGR